MLFMDLSEIPADLRKRYVRLLELAAGSKAQRRYARFQIELIERVAKREKFIRWLPSAFAKPIGPRLDELGRMALEQ
jgi:hypothetical protein